MKTIQMTIDEELLKQMEQKQIAGYQNQPVKPGEFDIWEGEQDWGPA
jgi:hypothetical protein